MRSLMMACALISACTPANVSDNRVMSDGKSNGVIASPGDSADAKPTGGDPNPALANFLPVAYSDDVEPLMQRLCTAACHTGAPAPGPAVLNSAESLKAALTQATGAIDGGRMPQNQADLNAIDKKFLNQLSISLKNWSKNENYATAISDFTITYVPAVNALSNALCLSCHSGDQAKAGLRLETQDQWKTAMPRILKAVEAGRMPPRIDEVQGPRLLKYLNAWQSQGFP